MIAQASATTTTNGAFWVFVVVIVVLAVFLIALAFRKRRTIALQKRFGPEYDRQVKTLNSQSEAEAELLERERRHRKLNIKPLTPGARDRYLDEWNALQNRFVDDPDSAIDDADRIIQNVMRDRGYPVDDFSRTTADLSVDHAGVIDNYRMAHAVHGRNLENGASTEEIRQAVIAYRSLFERLVVAAPERDEVTANERP